MFVVKALVIFALSALLTTTCAILVNYRECQGGPFKSSNVTIDIDGCEDANRCLLRKGTTYNLTTTFFPLANTTALKLRIYGKVKGIYIPYIYRPNICNETESSIGSGCNVNKGVTRGVRYQHRAIFPVRGIYPLMELDVKVMYSDRRRIVLVCFEIPVRIVAAEPKKADEV